MMLPDVTILVSAYREDAPDHERFKDWLQELVNGDEAYGMADLVCSQHTAPGAGRAAGRGSATDRRAGGGTETQRGAMTSRPTSAMCGAEWLAGDAGDAYGNTR